MNNLVSPLVTIMIPVFNRAELIEETLLSALNQKFDDFEVVVVDNNSSDDTYEIVKKHCNNYKNLRVFRNYINLGPVLNWEVGINKSLGKYLKILWSDDKIDPEFLKKTVPILEKNQEIGFVYTKTIVFSISTKKTLYKYGKTGIYDIDKFIKSHLFNLKSVPVSPGNALFRTKDIKKNLIISIDNPKNIDYPSKGAGNDLLLFLNCSRDYNKFYFVDESLAFFRYHSGSITINENLEEYYLYSKIYFLDNNKKYIKYEKIFKALIYLKLPIYNYMIHENYSLLRHIIHLLKNFFFVFNIILLKGYRITREKLSKRD
jgi:glycosyltransferase involved in cell wall biosynthesis